ncbi:hypothetical protein [Vibrio rarus]|uniref:hypothetical protein n=1 Tax=Vibrio rarus TaxID=413403 RepID=UPI0021C349C8|nr:hypothetical protein [Vibrio rarus]
MNMKPIQFVILGVIVGFFMNGLYDASQDAQQTDQVARQEQITFANCAIEAKDS